MEKNIGKQLKSTKGITLVALIVTIIVLLILAAVSLSAVFSQDGIFSRAEQARTRHEIAQLKEALELAKNPVLIDGVGKIDKNQYFDEIQKQELINDKTKDVVDNEDGTYDVTTKPGHVFLIELLPTKENPRDIKIDYIGEVGKILPIIRKLEVSATSTSITGKATVSRLGNGTIKYYYKVATAGDNEYKEITNVNIETGATQSTNITAGDKYIIKVVAKNDIGEVSDTKEITATKISVESITLKETEIVGKDKSVILTPTVTPDNATNKNLTWQNGDTTKVAITENEDGTITLTGIEAGTIVITASATDGSEKTASCTVTVKSISLNKTTTTIDKWNPETLIATVLPANTANKNVTWSSSNPAIATVNSNGTVSGVKAGTATITVSTTDESKATASCEVTINPTIADIVNQVQTTPKTIKDENGNQVVIPDGFRVLPHGTESDEIERVEYNYNEDNKPCVQDGIVISNNKNNQFVWIPIGEVKNKDNSIQNIILSRYTVWGDTPTFASLEEKVAFTKDGSKIIECWEESDISNFVTKSNKTKGYWLGRYEHGSYGTSNPDRESAKKVLESSSYQSDLVNSLAWDTALQFIEMNGYKGYTSLKTSNYTSNGRWTGEDDVCNIHDMREGYSEWTTEKENYYGNGVNRGRGCAGARYPGWVGTPGANKWSIKTRLVLEINN